MWLNNKMGPGTVNLTFSMDTIPLINTTTLETSNCYVLTEYEGRILYKFDYWIGDLSVMVLSISKKFQNSLNPSYIIYIS